MLYFLRKGDSRLTCETRLNPEGPGYELVVTEDGVTRSEQFEDLAQMLSREHELLQAWRAVGWSDVPHGRGKDPRDDPDWLGRRW